MKQLHYLNHGLNGLKDFTDFISVHKTYACNQNKSAQQTYPCNPCNPIKSVIQTNTFILNSILKPL